MKKIFFIIIGVLFICSLSALAAEEKNANIYKLYNLIGESGQEVVMRVDYVSESKKILNIGFTLNNAVGDGLHEVEFLTKDYHSIYFSFFYKQERLVQFRLFTDYKPYPSDITEFNVFQLKTVNDEIINFTFSWNLDGSIKSVNVKPEAFN